MRKTLFILFSISFFTCEDIIDIELNTSEPKLVIEASINWVKNTPGNEQNIKLSLSGAYFDVTTTPANNAQVSIFDSNNNEFVFIEDGNTGIYSNNNFIPELNGVFSLNINYKGEIYSATETLMSVASIDFVEQKNNGGFSGEETELKAYYTDPIDEENYYFFQFSNNLNLIPVLEVYDDEFNNGNQIFGFYTEEDLMSGDEVTIKNHGISQTFFEFMTILLLQNSEEGGGTFESIPATVRGNCINVSNPDNFPFGYFRLSEVDEVIYVVE